MNHKGTSQQQGFTIMEVVIVIALFAIILVALLSLFDWHQKIFILEQADVRATSSVRSTMNNMSKYVAQASNIENFHARLPAHLIALTTIVLW
ncbi:type II secretion system protein [bacterium]|nr:MAG: type II secretion system protein [bacterium]